MEWVGKGKLYFPFLSKQNVWEALWSRISQLILLPIVVCFFQCFITLSLAFVRENGHQRVGMISALNCFCKNSLLWTVTTFQVWHEYVFNLNFDF